MIPLRITASLDPLGAPLVLPDGYLHLDALLACAVCLRDNTPPILDESDIIPIEIPVEREPGRRFHMCSASMPVEWICHEKRFTQRRFPVELAPMMTDMKRVNLAAGAQKNFRIPLDNGRAKQLVWFLLGEPVEIRQLLMLISHLGKRRGVGYGKVARWDVESCHPWPGFPIVRDGEALRHLPPDWPGLVDPGLRLGCLSYPYWVRSREQEIAAPCP